MTTEDFIKKAKAVHGNKYDYSKVEYVNSHTKVCIICPEHGEFWQSPNNHFNGKGCPKCAHPNAGMTTEDFIKKAKAVHGNKYDYSKVEYVNMHKNVCIICPVHGEFWQTPISHLRGTGCRKCSKREKLTTKEFIEKAKQIHGDRYDYSKSVYKTTDTPVCIVCPEHGEFWQSPYSHLRGANCPLCSAKQRGHNYRVSTNDFISRAREVHGDKYDYSKTEYVNSTSKVCIICPEHGEFWQVANYHLNGCGCPKCAGRGGTTEEFIEKAKQIHGDKYDYSKSVYKGTEKTLCIICPEHGEFWQTPYVHLQGCGCPKCKVEKIREKKRKYNAEGFIAKAKEIHGDKYDYSKVEYIDTHSKVCIICPEHGEFWQVAKDHLKGYGCPKCSKNVQLTTDEFIRRAKEVHGDKYDYSKVDYQNSNVKVCIICPDHGEFWQAPLSHLNGCGCPKCSKNVQLTTDEFIRRAKEVHGDKYDYSKTEYVNNHKKVCIICPEHGEFWQNPTAHLRGFGCSKCSGWYKTTDEFIAQAREVHGNKYDYSKVEYVNATEKVCIICPEHGEFWQAPINHLSGGGCPNCHGLRKEYKFNLLQEFESEYAFRAFLANNDINILQVILRNVEPKYEPLKKDVERALANADEIDPIRFLEQKYSSDTESEEDELMESMSETRISTIDLDDDDAVNDVLSSTVTENDETDEIAEPSIEDVVRNSEQEIQVINRIEHMLTPEDREYIMEKFLNDKRRAWMAERENN